MNIKIKSFITCLSLAVFVATGTFAVLLPQTVSAAGIEANPKCAKPFLTFPVWYRGLTDADCNIVPPGTGKTDLSNFIWHIVLNVIDVGLQIVGYVSAFFILYGGFIFLTSSGEASNIAKARTTILNAVVGLVISIVSVAIVNLIFGII